MTLNNLVSVGLQLVAAVALVHAFVRLGSEGGLKTLIPLAVVSSIVYLYDHRQRDCLVKETV